MAKEMFMEQENKESKEKTFLEIAYDLRNKYPSDSFNEKIDEIESLGFEVHASTDQCENLEKDRYCRKER